MEEERCCFYQNIGRFQTVAVPINKNLKPIGDSFSRDSWGHNSSPRARLALFLLLSHCDRGPISGTIDFLRIRISGRVPKIWVLKGGDMSPVVMSAVPPGLAMAWSADSTAGHNYSRNTKTSDVYPVHRWQQRILIGCRVWFRLPKNVNIGCVHLKACFWKIATRTEAIYIYFTTDHPTQWSPVIPANVSRGIHCQQQRMVPSLLKRRTPLAMSRKWMSVLVEQERNRMYNSMHI